MVRAFLSSPSLVIEMVFSFFQRVDGGNERIMVGLAGSRGQTTASFGSSLKLWI